MKIIRWVLAPLLILAGVALAVVPGVVESRFNKVVKHGWYPVSKEAAELHRRRLGRLWAGMW